MSPEQEIFPELNDYCDAQPETMLKCTLKQYTCNTRNKTLLQIKKKENGSFRFAEIAPASEIKEPDVITIDCSSETSDVSDNIEVLSIQIKIQKYSKIAGTVVST